MRIMFRDYAIHYFFYRSIVQNHEKKHAVFVPGIVYQDAIADKLIVRDRL